MKYIIASLLVLFVIGFMIPNAFAEDTIIPSWIKNNAGWWAEGTIDDESFIQGIQFLIKEGIMKVPQPYQSNTSTGAEPPAWYD